MTQNRTLVERARRRNTTAKKIAQSSWRNVGSHRVAPCVGWDDDNDDPVKVINHFGDEVMKVFRVE